MRVTQERGNIYAPPSSSPLHAENIHLLYTTAGSPPTLFKTTHRDVLSCCSTDYMVFKVGSFAIELIFCSYKCMFLPFRSFSYIMLYCSRLDSCKILKKSRSIDPYFLKYCTKIEIILAS